MKTLIAAQGIYELLYDSTEKNVELVEKTHREIPLVTAKFSYDTSDGAAILSEFQYNITPTAQSCLTKIVTDMISNYLSGNKDRCKLFCYPGKYEHELKDDQNYRATNIERLMLRKKSIEKSQLEKTKLPSEVKIQILKSVIDKQVMQMVKLLKDHAYWATDTDETYIRKAIQNSVCLLAIENNSIIGLVRFISNGQMAYISDMVVDKAWRKQDIGTNLMKEACRVIDSKHDFSILISAKEGDGLQAAWPLYGKKCGFIDYQQSHDFNIYFRYIRMTPENALNSRNVFVRNHLQSCSFFLAKEKIKHSLNNVTDIIISYDQEDDSEKLKIS